MYKLYLKIFVNRNPNNSNFDTEDYGDFEIEQNNGEHEDYDHSYPNDNANFELEHDMGYFETEDLHNNDW